MTLTPQESPGTIALCALLTAVGADVDELDDCVVVLRSDYPNPADMGEVVTQARAALARVRAGRVTVDAGDEHVPFVGAELPS